MTGARRRLKNHTMAQPAEYPTFEEPKPMSILNINNDVWILSILCDYICSESKQLLVGMEWKAVLISKQHFREKKRDIQGAGHFLNISKSLHFRGFSDLQRQRYRQILTSNALRQKNTYIAHRWLLYRAMPSEEGECRCGDGENGGQAVSGGQRCRLERRVNDWRTVGRSAWSPSDGEGSPGGRGGGGGGGPTNLTPKGGIFLWKGCFVWDQGGYVCARTSTKICAKTYGILQNCVVQYTHVNQTTADFSGMFFNLRSLLCWAHSDALPCCRLRINKKRILK